MPTDRGASVFVDADYRRIDAADGPIQIAAYGPRDLSGGELALLRSRFEANLFEYAARAATAGRAWRRQAALAAIELSILGLLVAFMIINPSSVHFLIGWALPFGFFVAGLSALRAFMWRGLVRRGERLLRDGVILDTSPEGREGESLAYARDIWRTVDRGASARDLGALEHTADSVVHWRAGRDFYRTLRAASEPPPLGRRARLLHALVGDAPAGAMTSLPIDVQ